MIYRLTISLISPVHIGTGRVLLRDYDFKTVGSKTWVLNQDAILADAYDRAGAQADWNRLALPPGQLVRDAELHEGSPFVRYALAGTTTVDQVREQIKNVYDQCYLPGSSLKGALRTVLMSHALRSGDWKPEMNALGDRREWAGQQWEEDVFCPAGDRRERAGQRRKEAVSGSASNYDLMRALVVTDSDPLPISSSPLMLLNVQVFTADGQRGSPIAVEALRPDTVFHTTLRVDDYLFSPAAHALGFASRRQWLTDLARIAHQIGQARIAQEREWYREHPASQTVLPFYDRLAQDDNRLAQDDNRLAQARLGERAFILQIGWGAGWTAKSVGPWLPKAAQDALRRRYKLGRPPRAGWDWQPDLERPFPRSRRLGVRRSPNQGLFYQPLGWVLVEMEEAE